MPPRIPDNTRVKLRDGIGPEFYNGFALPGNEGWIRKHAETDRYGLERVFIEWDKDHWSYNGAPDRWTWEEHFDIVEDKMSDQSDDKREKLNTLLGAFADSLADILEDEPTSSAKVPQAPKDILSGGDEKEDEPSYEEILKEGVQAAFTGEAFFVIALRKDEDREILFPLVYHASKSPESSLIAQLQLSHVASSFHGNLVGQTLQKLVEGEKE